MVTAIPTSSHLLLPSTGSAIHRRSTLHIIDVTAGSKKALSSSPLNNDNKTTLYCGRRIGSVRCAAVDTSSEVETKKKSGYQILTLTSWLLKQEQAGDIDAELTIVLSSISMACKQIASLVQRAGISNLTGVQGAVNVQGEDQKKLDVVSNEVSVETLKGLSSWNSVFLMSNTKEKEKRVKFKSNCSKFNPPISNSNSRLNIANSQCLTNSIQQIVMVMFIQLITYAGVL